MLKVPKLFIVLTLFLGINGCGWFSKPEPEIVTKISYIYVYNKCPIPKVPEYTKLDNSSHIGSAFNINILVGNVEKMKSYNKSLLGSLECYDKQTKEINNDRH